MLRAWGVATGAGAVCDRAEGLSGQPTSGTTGAGDVSPSAGGCAVMWTRPNGVVSGCAGKLEQP